MPIPHRIADVSGDVLIYGDTVREPALRHEVPLTVGDAFLYVERGGERIVVIGALELPRMRELPGLVVHTLDEYGLHELAGSGLGREDAYDEVYARAVQELGVVNAVVPHTFAVGFADRLRAHGVEVAADRDLFAERRRVKNAHELDGIRRAQQAAEAGMAAAAELLRRPNGKPITSEQLKTAIAETFIEHGCSSDEFIVSHGPQSAIGHHPGAGELRSGEPIVIDIWPRDNESGCFADMTRTFVLGDPPDELVEWHRLVLAALVRGIADSRPGASGRAVYDATCDLFEASGFPTQRTKDPATPLEDGFFHGLGHGVGLEVHEAPSLGLISSDSLVAGDVVTVEPGLYRPGFGGVRLEDLVLVTENGPENLTRFPYDLAP
jgi:Xaa-Pro aminopeptidase